MQQSSDRALLAALAPRMAEIVLEQELTAWRENGNDQPRREYNELRSRLQDLEARYPGLKGWLDQAANQTAEFGRQLRCEARRAADALDQALSLRRSDHAAAGADRVLAELSPYAVEYFLRVHETRHGGPIEQTLSERFGGPFHASTRELQQLLAASHSARARSLLPQPPGRRLPEDLFAQISGPEVRRAMAVGDDFEAAAIVLHDAQAISSDATAAIVEVLSCFPRPAWREIAAAGERLFGQDFLSLAQEEARRLTADDAAGREAECALAGCEYLAAACHAGNLRHGGLREYLLLYARSYAEQRGSLRSQEELPYKEIARLDNSLMGTIRAFAAWLREDGPFQQELAGVINEAERAAYEHGVAQQAGSFERAKAIESFCRNNEARSPCLANLSMRAERYLKQHCEAFSRHPAGDQWAERIDAAAWQTALSEFDQCENAVRLARRELGGSRCSPADLRKALLCTTSERMRLVTRIYRDAAGESLERAIASNPNPIVRLKLAALLSGDRVAALAADALSALGRRRADRALIFEVGEQLQSNEERHEFEQVFNRTSQLSGGSDLRSLLRDKLAGDDLAAAEALLLEGNKATALAAALHSKLNHRWSWQNERGFCTTLEQILDHAGTPEQARVLLAEIGRAFERQYGAALERYAAERLTSARAWGLALLENDRFEADVHKLAFALRGRTGYVDRALIFEVFALPAGAAAELDLKDAGQEGGEYRAAAIVENQRRHAELSRRYGMAYLLHDLERDLQAALSKEDLLVIAALRSQGVLGASDRLRVALGGRYDGTDEAEIKQVLFGRPAEAIDELRAEYLGKYHRVLDEDLEQELSGDDRFDVRELMRGAPKTVAEQIAQLKRRYDYERGRAFSRRYCDLWLDEGPALDNAHRSLQNLCSAPPEHSSLHEAQLALLQACRRLVVTAEEYRRKKNGLAETSAGWGAALSAAGGTIAAGMMNGGVIAPAAVPLIALGAGGMRMLAKRLVQGGGYGREQLYLDAARAGVDLATLGVISSLPVGRWVGDGTAKALERLAAQGVSGAAGVEASSVISRLVAEAVQSPAVRLTVQRMLPAVVDAVLFTSPGIAGQSALRPDTWDGGVTHGLEYMVQDVLFNSRLMLTAGAASALIAAGGSGFRPPVGSAMGKFRTQLVKTLCAVPQPPKPGKELLKPARRTAE